MDHFLSKDVSNVLRRNSDWPMFPDCANVHVQKLASALKRHQSLASGPSGSGAGAAVTHPHVDESSALRESGWEVKEVDYGPLSASALGSGLGDSRGAALPRLWTKGSTPREDGFDSEKEAIKEKFKLASPDQESDSVDAVSSEDASSDPGGAMGGKKWQQGMGHSGKMVVMDQLEAMLHSFVEIKAPAQSIKKAADMTEDRDQYQHSILDRLKTHMRAQEEMLSRMEGEKQALEQKVVGLQEVLAGGAHRMKAAEQFAEQLRAEAAALQGAVEQQLAAYEIVSAENDMLRVRSLREEEVITKAKFEVLTPSGPGCHTVK